jgi:hypothetical protein
MNKPISVGLPIGLLGIFVCLSVVPAWSLAATISRAYRVQEGTIPNGSIVSLSSTRPDSITLADIAHDAHLAGISITGNGALLAVDQAATTVQVAASGSVPVQISTLNGDIGPGDSISVSPLRGVGMKAEPGLPIIGVASESFNARSANTTTQKVKDKQGSAKTITVGYLQLNIDLAGTLATDPAHNLNSLQRFFKSITGHVVSTIRIVSSIVITVIALLALSVLMYAAVYASITSIGRNPLAKFAVLHGLRVFVLLALSMVALTFGIVVLLLR